MNTSEILNKAADVSDEPRGRMRSIPEERFFAFVDKTDTCWLWTGSLDSHGYAKFKVNGRSVTGHRWAYIHLIGPVPEGLELDHLCRVRRCVNPGHLEPVTGAVNTLRSTGLTALNAAKTHCDKGHEFTPENTYRWNGSRICRTCKRAHTAASQRRRRAARREASR